MKALTELTHEFETAFDEDGLLLLDNDFEFTELVTGEYERQTGKSCVYWHSKGETRSYTTLPRPPEYETEGYTDTFWIWLRSLEREAYDIGAQNVHEVCLYIAGTLVHPVPPKFVWVATEETDDGEPPLWFFINEDAARSWLRDLFIQHVEHTKIPREHFIWHNEDGLHQVYDGDIKWGLSIRKVRAAFDPVNP